MTDIEVPAEAVIGALSDRIGQDSRMIALLTVQRDALAARVAALEALEVTE